MAWEAYKKGSRAPWKRVEKKGLHFLEKDVIKDHGLQQINWLEESC